MNRSRRSGRYRGALSALPDQVCRLKLDTALGKLSYPVFLTHIAVLYAFDFLQAKQFLALSPRGLVALQLLATLLVSLPFAFIDDFAQGLRKKIQRRNTKATPVRQPPSQFEPARI